VVSRAAIFGTAYVELGLVATAVELVRPAHPIEDRKGYKLGTCEPKQS